MPVKRRRRRVQKRRQRGGILPTVAAITPALTALGKAASLGAASGAASYGAK